MRNLAVVWLFAAFWSTVAHAQPMVGDAGNPDNWEIRGVASFEPDSVRRALRFDYPTLVGAHPRAPLAELPTILQTRCTEGYRHVGFPNAQVRVAYDQKAERISIAVDEGVRCRANDIVVTGVSRDVARRVSKRLSGDHRDVDGADPEFGPHGSVLRWIGPDGNDIQSEESPWKKGKPATFDKVAMKGFYSRAASSFEAAGYYQTQFTCDLTPRGALADLIINVSDLGPTAIVREIDVVGNQRNSDSDVIRQADIKPGVLFSTALRKRVSHDLWASGRFATQRIFVEPAVGGVNLKIAVIEAPRVPRLSEPLSREAHALLKCRQWLVSGAGKDRDVLFMHFHDGTFYEWVVSQAGMLLSSRPLDAPLEQVIAAPPEYALSLSSEGVGIYETARQRKLILKHPQLMLNLLTRLHLDPATPEYPFRFSFGFDPSASHTQAGNGHGVPVTLRSAAAPAFFVSLASFSTGAAQWEGRVMTLPIRDGFIRVDEDTGELLKCELGNGSTSIVTTDGAFDARRKQLRQATTGHHDHFSAIAPVSSVASFFSTSSLTLTIAYVHGATRDDLATLARHGRTANALIAAGLLRPIDEAVTRDVAHNKKDNFSIPWSEQNPDYMTVLTYVSIGAADYLFARNSWPWTVWREMGFAFAGEQDQMDGELRRLLDSDELGPLGHWLIAELLALWDRDAWAAWVAHKGKTRLDLGGFRGDTEALLSEVWPRFVPAIRWIAQLDEPTRRQFAQTLSIDVEVVEQLVEAIQDSADDEVQLPFLAALDRLWITRWRDLAKARMEKIVSERGPAALEAQRRAARNQ